jgi:hypothetical protein
LVAGELLKDLSETELSTGTDGTGFKRDLEAVVKLIIDKGSKKYRLKEWINWHIGGMTYLIGYGIG